MIIEKKSILIYIIFCVILCMALMAAGCTNTAPAPGTVPGTTMVATPAGTVSAQVPAARTLIAFTAASLKGVSDAIGPAYSNTTPGTTVKFNLDGTQVLKQQAGKWRQSGCADFRKQHLYKCS